MAPVYDFRHVELDKIGRGKRIVKPPGGECSDIFGVQNGTTPHSPDQITPRKSNNYMQSTIFSPDSPDSPYSSGQHTPTTPSKLLDTADRLFGSHDEQTPRKIVNRQRSSIFEEEVTPRNTKTTSARRHHINPITGAPICENGVSNGFHNGTSNGIANGTPNGSSPNGSVNGHTNGMSNGHSSPDSPMNGTPRVRNPPGGKSSGIF